MKRRERAAGAEQLRVVHRDGPSLTYKVSIEILHHSGSSRAAAQRWAAGGRLLGPGRPGRQDAGRTAHEAERSLV